MDKLIERTYNYVKEKFDDADNRNYGKTYFFDYHILPAFKIALKLAEKYKADQKLIGVAILLHDIGNIDLVGDKDHAEEGARKIEGIFNELGIRDPKFMEEVKECIRNHEFYSGDNLNIKIIVSADAMSHLTTSFFFKKVTMGNKSFEEFRKWCLKKIDKDFGRIPLKDEKEMCKEYHKVIKHLLSSEYDLI